MKRIILLSGLVAGLLAIVLFAAGPATAQPPTWNEDGRKGNVSRDGDSRGPKQVQSRDRNQETRHQQDRHGEAQQPRWNEGGNKGMDSGGPRRDQPGDRRQETRHQQDYRHSGPPHQDRHGDRHEQRFFAGHDRSPIDRYYADQYRRGKCPPGLAKKGGRCVPRGQAKRWVMYRPLPREVIFYDLPPDVLVYLGPPPPRHRFVRVAQDILLIAVGTGMVVDAIEDLGGIY